MVLCGLLCGWIADWLINSQRLTITNTRKLFQFIGHWIPAFALLVLAYGIRCGDHTLAILLLCVAVGVNGASYSGYQVKIFCTRLALDNYQNITVHITQNSIFFIFFYAR